MNRFKLLPVILCLAVAFCCCSLSAKTNTKEGSGTPSVNTEITSVVSDPSELNSACTIAVPPTITANGPTTICAGGHVHLSTGNYAHYHWNTGANTQGINAFFTGTYHVTVTDNHGCTGVASIHVTVHASPHPTIHMHGPFSWCAGSVSLDAGAGYSSYSWSNGATTQLTTANSIGFYSCTVTNQFGCTGVAYRFVIALPNPTVSITQTGTLACGNSGSVNLTANGGFGVTGYSWNTNQTSPSITVTTAGTYCVTVSSFWGCTASACHQVTGGNNSISCSISANGPTTFCSGNSVGLDAGSFASYLWSTGEVTETINATAAGTYSATVTDANGCTCASAIDITVNASPVPQLTYSSPPIFCNGGNVTLDAGTWASYLWSTGDQVETITLSNGGNYCVTVTDGNGCSGVACQQVTVNPVPNPQITLTSGSLTFCDGGYAVLDAGTWDDYSWSPNGETVESITATQTGTYCVVITDGDGCTGMACVDVTNNPNPTPSIGGSLTACSGNCVTLDAGSFNSYLWTDGSTSELDNVCSSGQNCVTVWDGNGCSGSNCVWVTIYDNPNPSITDANGNSGPFSACQGNCVTLDAGSWSSYLWDDGSSNEWDNACSTGEICVTVWDINGCSASTCAWVTINDNPTPSISGVTTTCQGNSVSLDAGQWNAYSWSDSDVTETTSVNTSGSVCVTVTDGNGCMGSTCTNVTINPNPAVTAGDVSGCAGTDIQLLGSPANGTWSVSNPYNNNVAGNYTYVYSYTDGNGCSGQATSNITINGNPTPSISGPSSACAGSSATLSAGQWAGYSWSTGSNNSAIIVNQSGDYCVTVTDGNGCMGSACSQFTSNPNPTPSISGPTAICAGGAANLSAGNYSSYSWTGGATTPTISATTAGNYCVTVTDGNNCMGTACTSIAVSPAPATPVITGPSLSCQGTATLSTTTYNGYLWSNGATTQSTNVTTTGTYYVTVSNATGCTAVGHWNITIGATPVPVITANGPLTFCQGSSVSLSVVNNTGYTSYLWSNGSTNNPYGAPITTAGTYSVTVSYVNGCTGSTSATVVVNNFVTPTITPGPIPNSCSATSMVLSANSGFATYSWNNGLTTQSINIYATGTYTVSVTNTNGCNGVASYSTSANFCPKPTESLSASPAFSSCGGSVTVDAGAGWASYAWSNGATTETVNVLATALYTVTVTNACGCSASAQHAVQILAGPSTTIIATGLNTYCSGSGSVTLSATSGYGAYLWSNGATTSAITLLPGNNGNYCVTITTTGGCSGSSCVPVTSSCVLPTNLATTNILAASAYTSWNEPACESTFTVILTDVTTSTVHGTYTFLNSHYQFSGLTAGHTYSWTIQTNCNAAGTVNSGPSAAQLFTTPRLEVESNSNTITAFSVYPNPANDHATVVFNSDNTSNYTLKLIDVTGRVIMSEVHASAIGDNQVELNLSNVAKGLYFCTIETNDQKLETKIIVQ